jgi:hypothetical protein
LLIKDKNMSQHLWVKDRDSRRQVGYQLARRRRTTTLGTLAHFSSLSCSTMYLSYSTEFIRQKMEISILSSCSQG